MTDDDQTSCPACNGQGIIPIHSPSKSAPDETTCPFCLGLREVTKRRANWWKQAHE